MSVEPLAYQPEYISAAKQGTTGKFIIREKESEVVVGYAYSEERAKAFTAAPELIEIIKAPDLDHAHDKLSELLEDPDASNDDIREAALTICAELCNFSERRRKVLAVVS